MRGREGRIHERGALASSIIFVSNFRLCVAGERALACEASALTTELTAPNRIYLVPKRRQKLTKARGLFANLWSVRFNNLSPHRTSIISDQPPIGQHTCKRCLVRSYQAGRRSTQKPPLIVPSYLGPTLRQACILTWESHPPLSPPRFPPLPSALASGPLLETPQR